MNCLAPIQLLKGIAARLLSPRRVSIAIDDLLLFGERGAAVRAQVREVWWLSPVWVEFKEGRILAFGLWLPRTDPVGQGHPDTRNGDYDARRTEEPSKDPALSNVIRAETPDVGVASPLANPEHTAAGRNNGSIRPAPGDARKQCCCRYACCGVPPVQPFADAGDIHSSIKSHAIN